MACLVRRSVTTLPRALTARVWLHTTAVARTEDVFKAGPQKGVRANLPPPQPEPNSVIPPPKKADVQKIRQPAPSNTVKYGAAKRPVKGNKKPKAEPESQQQRIERLMGKIASEEKADAEWTESLPQVPIKHTISAVDAKTGKVLRKTDMPHISPPPLEVDSEYEKYWAAMPEHEREGYLKNWKQIDDLIENEGIRNLMWYRGFGYCTGKSNSPIDYRRGRYYYKLAADLDCPESQELLAGLYEEGKGGEVDMEAAWKYAMMSANHGHPRAMLRVGRWLIKSPHPSIPSDPTAGRNYIIAAAEAGLWEAFKDAGIVFKDGIGGEVSLVQAEVWLARYEAGLEDKRKNPTLYRRGFWTKKGDRPSIPLSSVNFRPPSHTQGARTGKPGEGQQPAVAEKPRTRTIVPGGSANFDDKQDSETQSKP